MANAYVFFGPSGSGKGTQAELLKKTLEEKGRRVLYVETGELFREFVEHSDTHTSSLIKKTMDEGGLIPAFLPIWTWTQFLINRFTGAEDLVFDGVSRRAVEAPVLDSALSYYGIEERFVIVLEVDDEEAAKRLIARGRSDDTEEDIKERLEWYKADVVPVLEYFEKKREYDFLRIDGERSVEEIHNDIMDRIY